MIAILGFRRFVRTDSEPLATAEWVVVKCHPSGLRGIMEYQNLDFVGLKQELSNNQITVRHGFKI